MLKYLKKYWYFCLLAPLCMAVETLAELIQPDMMAEIVDNGVLMQNMSVVLDTGIKMVIIVVAGGIGGILCNIFSNLAAQGFSCDLRKDLFKNIMELSFQQTDDFTTGSLVTRLGNDVSQVERMVLMSVRAVIRSSMLFIGGILMLLKQSPKFALIALILFPLVLGVVSFFLKKTSPLFAAVQQKLDAVNNVMQENIAGARVVKAYVSEDYELERFDGANDTLCDTNLRVQSILAYMNPGMNILMNMGVVAVMAIGGFSVKAGGSVSPGQIMAAITYMTMILNSILFMSNIFQTFTRAKASASRISEVLDCGCALKSGDKTESDQTGEIEFQHVYFDYPGGECDMVLEDVSFTVHRGETFAIIGETGCGKSTLVNLIPRFYDVTEGKVLVDGIDVRDYDIVSLRDKIAIALQRSEIYSRPIEANIRWGRRNATPWEIKSAAEIAQADGFICDTEYGYHTQVTEGGHSLSGGQKQRLSIARAVLQNAEIMIFDDSTSALDLKTEAEFYKALNRERPDTTTIIIAQRIASVKNADRIAVLNDGKIAACGTHKELLESSDIYREIYNSQLKEDDDE